jgi:hypothetical protein
MSSTGQPKWLVSSKSRWCPGPEGRQAVGCELFGASHASWECARGQICLGEPRWVAAMWMRLAIKPIAMRREKTINIFIAINYKYYLSFYLFAFSAIKRS